MRLTKGGLMCFDLRDVESEEGYHGHYNFARVHKTLRCSPAMAAGADSRLWEIRDIVAMIEAHENSN